MTKPTTQEDFAAEAWARLAGVTTILTEMEKGLVTLMDGHGGWTATAINGRLLQLHRLTDVCTNQAEQVRAALDVIYGRVTGEPGHD